MKFNYIIFDIDTTGFDLKHDHINSICAIKYENGQIVDIFNCCFSCNLEIKKIKEFISWSKGYILINHNYNGFTKYFFSKVISISNPIIDTLTIFRTTYPNLKFHYIETIAIKQGIKDVKYIDSILERLKLLNEVVIKMNEKINIKEFIKNDDKRTELHVHTTMSMLDSVIKPKELLEYVSFLGYDAVAITDHNSVQSFPEISKIASKLNNLKVIYGAEISVIDKDNLFHISVLVQNKKGLKNLYKLISEVNINSIITKKKKISKDKVYKYRDGLLIGSGCSKGEIFKLALSNNDDKLKKVMQFYDYIEVQPLEGYTNLINDENSSINSLSKIRNCIKKIIAFADELGIMVCATSDAHHLKKEDKICRDVIIYNRNNNFITADKHFYTTIEMLEAFKFLNVEKAKEIVISNPNKIANLCEKIFPITEKNTKYLNKENLEEKIKNIVCDKAKELYGNNIPKIIDERIKDELKLICDYDLVEKFLIYYELVKENKKDGFKAMAVGNIGSSLIAYLMGITEINPLQVHYRCPKCKTSIFTSELNSKYKIGFDLPDKNCPFCNTKMIKDGNDIHLEIFFGISENSIPDIILNISDLNYDKTISYLKKIVGEDYIYKAGIIGKCKEYAMINIVKDYCKNKNIVMDNNEINRIAKCCDGVKKMYGIHPAKIIISKNIDIFDLTPIELFDHNNQRLKITHFDYANINKYVLNIDIVGHVIPTLLKKLESLTGIDINSIPLDDENTFCLFSSSKLFDKNISKVGTLGIPNFDSREELEILEFIKPKSFKELIKVFGFSKNTSVWNDEIKEYLKNKMINLDSVISSKDDIMVYLINHGIDRVKAFEIMEFVKNGRTTKDSVLWQEYKKILKNYDIPDWYIKSCERIKYLSAKSHILSYVINSYRIAWYKVHNPLEFYTAYFEVINDDIDVETIEKGKEQIKLKILEMEKNKKLTFKDLSILKGLKIIIEAMERGITVNIKSGYIGISDQKKSLFIYDKKFYQEIKKFITEEKEISIAKVQRKFKFGYNHALSLISDLKNENKS